VERHIDTTGKKSDIRYSEIKTGSLVGRFLQHENFIGKLGALAQYHRVMAQLANLLLRFSAKIKDLPSETYLPALKSRTSFSGASGSGMPL
jgi:hypothetical protein